MEYVIDVTKPAGQRITRLTYRGQPVADGDEFSVCLSSYRASGAGGYPGYPGCPVIREIEREMTDLILEYFAENPRVELPRMDNYEVRY